MEDFNRLIKYRSYYEYDFGCEAFRVKEGEDSEEAQKLYSHYVRDYQFVFSLFLRKFFGATA